MKNIRRNRRPVNVNRRPLNLIPGLDYIFDIEGEIAAYLENLGIVNHNLECDVQPYDPDDNSYEFNASWDEDDDRQSFTVRNSQRFTDEEIFDLWVRERESLHAHYLEWLKTEATA